MPIFLNENQELKGKQFKIPNKLQTHLNQTLSQLDGYKTSKGYKRLNSLVNPSYNKRSNKSNNKNGTYLTYGDLKKIDFEFRHMDKDPNNIQRKLNGGEEMASFVRNTLNRERTKVAPVLKQKKIETRNKNKVKPVANPTKPIQIGNVKANLHESSDYHPYYERLCDYDARYVLYAFNDNENIWLPLINPNMYQKALDEFTRYGKLIKFPTRYIYQWMGIIMKNTALLRSCTELCGHDSYFPIDDFIDVFFEDDYDEWEKYKEEIGEDEDFYAAWQFLEDKGFEQWCLMPDGSDALSDFGINPLEKIINEYNQDLSPEKVLVLVNKCLDVTHQRGDLSSIFIEGGSKALTKISESLEHKKIYINEDKLYLLNDLLFK